VTAPATLARWSEPAPALAQVFRGEMVRARRLAPSGAVLFTLLVAHVAVTPHLAVRGAAPDVLLVGVAAVAARRGPRGGAAFGFAAGLGADLFLATPLGTSALAFTVTGHVLGQCHRPRPPGSAAALCSPDSTCFACRSGRRHDSAPAGEPPVLPARSHARGLRAGAGGLPTRVRRRAAARRAAIRRSLVLALLGVAAGRLATASVATALGGVPFPGVPGLVGIAGVAAVSAPLGPPIFAAARRLPGAGPAGGRR
jgi:hypothetical protein